MKIFQQMAYLPVFTVTFNLLRMHWLMVVLVLGGEVVAKGPECQKTKCCELYVTDKQNGIGTNGKIWIGEESFPITGRSSFGVTICYPNTLRFIGCLLWKLYSDEVKKEGYAIMLKSNGKRFEPGEYAEEKDGYWVCVFNDSIIYSKFKNQLNYAYVTGYVISIVSLLITFTIQMSVKKPMTNQKAVLLSHVSSLFIGYLMLLIQYTIPSTSGALLCFGLSAMVQFCFLAAHCWLNILAFVHWRKFASFQSLVLWNSGVKVKLFLYKCLCGWGIPLVLCIIAISLHLSKITEPSLHNCWIENKIILLATFYGPMGLSVIINSVLTIIMICNIRKSKKVPATIAPNFIHKKIDIFRLTIKLIAIMHISWIFEVIAWLHGDDKRYWFPVDIVNSLQGFFLFLAYHCKRDNLKKLATTVKRWWKHVTKKKPTNSHNNGIGQLNVSVVNVSNIKDEK